MATLAYARTSTADKQVLDSQLDALAKHGYDKLFTDQATGKNRERKGLADLLEYAREGDTVVCYSLSRLSRSTKDAIEISEELNRRGIQLVSLTEGIDTTTPAGRMYFTIIAAFAQMQREQIVENTKAGLEAARARGRSGGRPKKSAKAVEQAMLLYDSKTMSAKDIEKMTGVSRSTLYRHLRERAEKEALTGQRKEDGYKHGKTTGKAAE